MNDLCLNNITKLGYIQRTHDLKFESSCLEEAEDDCPTGSDHLGSKVKRYHMESNLSEPDVNKQIAVGYLPDNVDNA